MTGRRVVIFGRYPAARRVIRRYAASGARVTAVLEGPMPPVEVRPPAVRFVARPDPGDRSAVLRLIGAAWLVVLVDRRLGPESDTDPEVRRLAAHLRILVTTAAPAEETGNVTLVGGGPGVTSLLTVAAAEALLEADVVCYDRLAPSDDLPRLAPAAEFIDVGKTPYHHQKGQDRIEDLLIERARLGQSVVRLKGGDPFVFGRGGEELLACATAGVPTRVVSGVSSAIAVPAAAGIPLTHRGISHGFSVISGHVLPSAGELRALVELRGTIVILMGIANLAAIVAGLRAAGLDDDLPAAVVERGYSDSQRTTVTSVGRLALDARRLDVASPAVVVIGEVARFAVQSAAALPLVELPSSRPVS